MELTTIVSVILGFILAISASWEFLMRFTRKFNSSESNELEIESGGNNQSVRKKSLNRRLIAYGVITVVIFLSIALDIFFAFKIASSIPPIIEISVFLILSTGLILLATRLKKKIRSVKLFFAQEIVFLSLFVILFFAFSLITIVSWDWLSGNQELWGFKTEREITSSPVVSDGVVYFGSDDKLYAVNAQTGQELWKFRTEGDVNASYAVYDGVVYFGCGDGRLCAVNIQTGQELWKFMTSMNEELTQIVQRMIDAGESEENIALVIKQFDTRSGDGVYSSPVVSDGVVYFGSSDAHLYAANTQTGQELWKFGTEGGIYSSPAVSDGVVYFGSNGIFPNDGYLYAVSTQTGQELWKFKTEGSKLASSPAVSEGVVYFGYDDKLYAVNAQTGQELWRFKKSRYSIQTAVSEGVVYFGSDDKLYAVNVQTGRELWKFRTEGDVNASYAVYDGVVYFGSNDNNLYAANAQTGQELWRFKTEGNLSYYRSTPAVSDGVVYFSSDDHYLYAVNAQTGEGIWMLRTRGGIHSSPAVSEGVVYFSSDNHYLRAKEARLAMDRYSSAFRRRSVVFNAGRPHATNIADELSFIFILLASWGYGLRIVLLVFWTLKSGISWSFKSMFKE